MPDDETWLTSALEAIEAMPDLPPDALERALSVAQQLPEPQARIAKKIIRNWLRSNNEVLAMLITEDVD